MVPVVQLLGGRISTISSASSVVGPAAGTAATAPMRGNAQSAQTDASELVLRMPSRLAPYSTGVPQCPLYALISARTRYGVVQYIVSAHLHHYRTSTAHWPRAAFSVSGLDILMNKVPCLLGQVS